MNAFTQKPDLRAWTAQQRKSTRNSANSRKRVEKLGLVQSPDLRLYSRAERSGKQNN